MNEVAREVERSLEDIGQILRVSLEEPVRGIIYNSRSEAKAAFPNQSRATTEQQVFQGFAYPERGLFVGIGLSSRLIVHETAHLLLNEAVSSPGARVPAWVNEGFASHVESGRYGSTRVFSGGDAPDRMPLRHMDSVPGRDLGHQVFLPQGRKRSGLSAGDPRRRTFSCLPPAARWRKGRR